MIYKCRRARCNERLDKPGFCSAHADKTSQRASYDRTKRDKEAKRFYSSKAWLNARELYISTHVVCEHCKCKPSELVHHRTAAKLLEGIQKLQPEFLQALCWGCHSRLEEKRRRTGDPDAELDSYVPIDWKSMMDGKHEGGPIHACCDDAKTAFLA